MQTYRARGIRKGRTVNELVRAADDDGAREGARTVATRHGFELKKLFRLGRPNRPDEIALA
jgi:hypothetical protein